MQAWADPPKKKNKERGRKNIIIHLVGRQRGGKVLRALAKSKKAAFCLKKIRRGIREIALIRKNGPKPGKRQSILTKGGARDLPRAKRG